MTIVAKIKDWVNTAVGGIKHHRRDIWIGLCIALTSWSAYNVGRIRAFQEAQNGSRGLISDVSGTGIPAPSAVTIRQASKAPVRTDLRVVASKSSSSKKYHYTSCAGASKIKDSNKIWFDTAAEAEEKGYTLAGNCRK